MLLIHRVFSFVVLLVKKFYRAFIEMDNSRRIKFGDGFYFQLPKLRVELFLSATPETISVSISLAEARKIFDAIKSAYDLQDITKIKAGDLTCETDCRLNPKHPDRVQIKFEGSLSALAFVKRTAVAAAIEQYEAKFRALLG